MTAQAEPMIDRLNMVKRLNKFIVSKIIRIRLLTSTPFYPPPSGLSGPPTIFSARLDLAGFSLECRCVDPNCRNAA